MNTLRGRLIVLLLAAAVSAYLYVQFRSPWVEVDERDFERRVLQASVPVLVYFDTAIGCRGSDSVFSTLRKQHRGTLEVFYVNSIRHPALARTYGVGEDVVFVLFENGRVTRRATAPTVLASVTAKNNGFYSDEGFLAEMEIFVGSRS
jgi:hypothetical protein